ncbi:probable glutathione S-transferase GSTU6 [Miscanthus floridulus]|uniref:probable glutathione S-transferase GSTU6 n=1 Tax=Miscanthus floridulus TaxID=154761 RepID=UPI003458A269
MALRTLRGMIDGDNAAAVEQVAAALAQLEEAFTACSTGQRFFTGDDIGFLDIVLGSYVGWFQAAERITGQTVLDEMRMPRLVAWAARFCGHKTVRDVMPDAERLIEFDEALWATLAANANANAQRM